MKLLARPDGARMHRADDWKKSAYAFVPYQTHFGELCGFADDVVAPGRGFGMHPHRDMEISTVMLRGAQAHQDSTGARLLLEEGAVQTMSAGTGIAHREVNASATAPFHSLQIWVYPRAPGAAPRHARFAYDPGDKTDRLLLALSPDGREGSARIGQDAFFTLARLTPGARRTYALRGGAGHGVYVHCASGALVVAGTRLGPGDAVGVYETEAFEIEHAGHGAPAELVAVEVPMERGVRV